MLSTYEATIRREVACSGIGLHSGNRGYLRLLPAAAGAGIVFVRTDLGGTQIPVGPENIVSTHFSTTLGNPEISEATIRTTEHLLSAVSALGISNLTIEVNGPEVPILDGSATPFVNLLQEAGILRQERLRPILRIDKPMTVSEHGKWVTLLPSESLEIFYQVEYPDVPRQCYFYRHTPEAYTNEIAPARTFGFKDDIQALRRQGLIRGALLENAVVLDKGRALNSGGLRFKDEIVRHKVLDLIGDMAIFGTPLICRIEASCSGHWLHAKLLHMLTNHPTVRKHRTQPLPIASRPLRSKPAGACTVGCVR